MLSDHLVPRNRWDLLAGLPAPRPDVTVVVTHYDQPHQLALTWAALCAQTLAPVEVIIADDGSAELPVAPPGGPPAHVVTQPDLGFRAGAIRNLAAGNAIGEVLVFLDADTVPEPRYVEELTRHVALCPDVLAVGRRRHADLSAMRPGGDPAAAPRLSEPEWLRRGHEASRDLLDADGGSFRHVIGAVVALRRSLFVDIGGFDERYVGYGGEDWDLAYLAWNNGAVLVHERAAVAWHDGPDWAERPQTDEQRRRQKRAEAARIAELIPEPVVRGAARPGPGGPVDVLIDVAAGLGGAAEDAVARSLRDQVHDDLAVRLPHDPPWSDDRRRRARVTVTVEAPLPPHGVRAAADAVTTGDLAEVTVSNGGAPVAVARSTRAEGRARRWGSRSAAEVRAGFGTGSIELHAPA